MRERGKAKQIWKIVSRFLFVLKYRIFLEDRPGAVESFGHKSFPRSDGPGRRSRCPSEFLPERSWSQSVSQSSERRSSCSQGRTPGCSYPCWRALGWGRRTGAWRNPSPLSVPASCKGWRVTAAEIGQDYRGRRNPSKKTKFVLEKKSFIWIYNKIRIYLWTGEQGHALTIHYRNSLI